MNRSLHYCLVFIGLSYLLSLVQSSFDDSAQIRLLSLVDSTLAVGDIHSTLIQDGFKSRFFLNDSGLETEILRQSLFSHIRTLPVSYYHMYAGFENGAFLGYYQSSELLLDTYALAYQSHENHSCAYNYSSTSWQQALNVSQSNLAAIPDPHTTTLSSHCLEIFESNEETGSLVESVEGVAFDCRRRSWYYETKQANLKQWTSMFIDALTNQPAIGRCAPLINQTTQASSFPPSLRLDSHGLLGVTCAGLYLKDLANELLEEFGELSEANPGAFIVERSSGRLVAASDTDFSVTFDNITNTLVRADESSSELIRFASAVISNYSSNWPNDYNTVAWVRNYSYPTLQYEAYYISTVYLSQLGWDLIIAQFIECPQGSYIDTEDNTCSECISPFYSSSSSAVSCDVCVEGYFMNGATCEACPRGTVCEGDTSTENIELKSGYWRISPSSLIIYECPYGDACRGGSDFYSDGQSYCEGGYRGPLCSLCESGRYLTESDECVRCNGAGNVFIRLARSPRLLIFTLILIVFLAFFIYYNLYCLSTPLYAEDFLSENGGEFDPERKEARAMCEFRKEVLKLQAESDSYAVNDLDGSVTFTETDTRNLPESTTQCIEVEHTTKAMFTVSTTITTATEQRLLKKTTVLPSSFASLMASKLVALQVKIKVLTSYTQIAVSVGFNCAVSFPTMFESTLNTLKFVTLDFISALGLSCKFHQFDYIHRLMIMTISPLIISIVLMFLYGFSALVHQLFKRDGPSKSHLDSYVVPDPLKGSFKVKEINNFKNVFAYLDRHQTGAISQHVLEKAVLEFEPDLYEDQVASKVASMMSEANKHHDGAIHFDEFLFAMLMARRRHNGTNFSILVDKVEAKVNREYGQTIFFIFLFLTFIVLAGNSTALFHFLKCDRFPDGEGQSFRYVSTDYSINCDGKRYKSYVPFAIVMIMVYPVGIPSLYFFLLWQHRLVLRDQAALDREEATGFPTIGHLTFLVSSYKPEYYWFEVLDSGRRLILASLIGIANIGLASTPVIGLLISLIFVWVFTSLKPYKENDDNTLAIILAFSITLIFLAALMIKVDLDSYNSAEAASFDALLVLVLFAGPMVLIVNIIIGDPETVKEFIIPHSNDRRRSARSVEHAYLNSIKAEMKDKEIKQHQAVTLQTHQPINRFRWPWDRRGRRGRSKSPQRQATSSLDRAPLNESQVRSDTSKETETSPSPVYSPPAARPVGAYAPKSRQIQANVELSPTPNPTPPAQRSKIPKRSHSPKSRSNSPKASSRNNTPKKKKKAKPKLQVMNEITASGIL